MQILGDKRIISASDLNDRLACRHLLFLNLEKALGQLDEEPVRSDAGELLAQKGDEHEDAYLQSLKDDDKSVIELSGPNGSGIEALEAAAEETRQAMAEGPDVIFQATFFDGESRGHTDFLFRVETPSELGDYSYEVADTKLARSAKPYFIVQLCFYSELLTKVQGAEPEQIHVILGTNEQQTFRLADFAAYYRQLRRTFTDDFEAGVPESAPYPVAHCDICGWKELCENQWEASDHLSRVAGIRRDQVEKLEKAGTTTLAELAESSGDTVDGLRDEALDKLRSQASLQVESRKGEPAYRLLEPREERGFERLPLPSEGDIFFDFEGDPLYSDQGLEYLFGYVLIDSGEPVFEYLWAGDPIEEKRAFEDFIDFVDERRQRYPDLHIYHYAPYEVTALKRLAGQYATREFELDELLRGGVFVDLYKVVKESLMLGQPSYSIKKVEAYYRPDQDGRETAVADGGDSIVQFETWLETGDEEIKNAILEYNEDDCVSTVECRDWLLERRDEAIAKFGTKFPWFLNEYETSENANATYEENEGLRKALDEGVPDAAAERDSDQQARWLMARLVDYHERERKPGWWEYFDRRDYSDPDDLVDEPEAVGGLVEDPDTPARPEKKSVVHRMLFEPQETKLGPGRCVNPDWEKPEVTIVEISPSEGWLELKRGPTLSGTPLPHGLIAGGPFDTKEQRGAVKRLATSIAAEGLEGTGSYRACRDLLRSRAPRIEGIAAGQTLIADEGNLDELCALADRMDETCLFIQGPPGAGKTFSGSHLIVSLIQAGKRVGVTANSHKAINNLLEGVEEVASEQSADLRGLKKGKGLSQEFQSDLPAPLIGNSDKNDDLNDPSLNLVAGTAWYFCREDTLSVDYLFVDEAGQVSLADALALGTAARNIVLLGDPQQLAQVKQASHPEGSGVSALEHLLGEHQTVPADRGVFLSQTWRMHPDVTGFVSELMYEGRLRSAPDRERQAVVAEGDLTGTGLRWRPVTHHLRSQRSPEEAKAVSEMVGKLTDGSATYVDAKGTEHPLALEDILIVSPYNAQVRCLIDELPDGAQVGTVDKFQGQQAEVVIFSMATSSGDDIPRNIEFLFSLNRINVAISRARCLAVLVASPGLLEVEAKTVEQMRLINALCRFAELGDQQPDPEEQETFNA